MKNKEYIINLRPDDMYAALYWAMHDYGGRFTSTPHAVISWLESEVVVGEWQKVRGCVTAGGDPVYVCPRCKRDQHVYGIEHPSEGHTLCRVCGCFNMYPRGYDINATKDTATDAGRDS